MNKLLSSIEDMISSVKHRSYSYYSYPKNQTSITGKRYTISTSKLLFLEDYVKFRLLSEDRRIHDYHTLNADIVDDVFIYSEQDFSRLMYSNKMRYNEFISIFCYRHQYYSNQSYHYSYKGEDYNIISTPGKILDKDGNLLACIVVEIDETYFIKNVEVFVDQEFIMNPIYTNVYKKFNQDFFENFIYQTDTKLTITKLSNIQDVIYRNDYEERLYNQSLEDLLTFVNETSNNLLKI